MQKKDAETLNAIATIGAAFVALHGITSKNWGTAHTVFLVLGIVAAVATLES